MRKMTAERASQLVREGMTLSKAERLEKQQERLHELVDYVREHSPYFKQLYKDLPTSYKLEDLPSTSKEGLMKCYEDWVTDREVREADVKDYIHSSDPGKGLYLGRYSALTTSGTTAEPMPMLRDATHNLIHGAMMGQRLMGNVPADLMQLKENKVAAIIFTDPSVSSYGSFLRMKEAQKEYAHRAIAISPTEGTKEIVRKLNEFQPDFLTCYPSALCAIAVEQKMGNMNIHPKAIACSAEVLTEEMHALFTDTFQCPVLNNYCSTEGGEVAMSSDCPHLHINEDFTIVEPVGGDSQWSDGVYITDLTNYIQPVIRYYMKDQVKISQGCDCGNPLPTMKIRGRAGGVTTICDCTVMIVNFYSVYEVVSNVYDVQFLQKDENTIEIRGKSMPGYDHEERMAEIRQRLVEMLDREGCKGYEIVISKEDAIRSNRGGKLQYFMDVRK